MCKAQTLFVALHLSLLAKGEVNLGAVESQYNRAVDVYYRGGNLSNIVGYPLVGLGVIANVVFFEFELFTL